MHRPKMGFAIPFENWMTNDLKEQVMYFLDEKRIAEQDIFNTKYVINIRDQFFAGKKDGSVLGGAGDLVDALDKVFDRP